MEEGGGGGRKEKRMREGRRRGEGEKNDKGRDDGENGWEEGENGWEEQIGPPRPCTHLSPDFQNCRNQKFIILFRRIF